MNIDIERPPSVEKAIVKSEEVIPKTELERIRLAASALDVQDDESLGRAGQLLRLVVNYSDAWEKYWEAPITSAHRVHKMLLDYARPLRKEFAALRASIESRMRPYVESKQRLQERQQSIIAANVERARMMAEAMAEEAMLQGRVEVAQELQMEAASIVMPVVPDTTPDIEKVSTKENWDVRVTDIRLLVHAVAEGKAPVEVFKVDEAYLKRRAREMGGLNWPGVRAIKKTGFAVSRGE